MNMHTPKILLAVLAALVLAACGDTSKTNTLDDISHDADPENYTGPDAATDDVLAFQAELWSKIAGGDRCGACHNQVTGQAPLFARDDDVNLAYAAANPLVNLANPEESELVARVASGHNCWREDGDTDICAEEMATYIRNWAQASIGGPASTVTLVAPPEYIPGATKNFPPTSTLFAATVWPVLNEYCERCHAPDAENPQAPFFAQDNVDAAYSAARNAINLNSPASSRFVQRLGEEAHNCWDVCADNAAEMQAAIQAMADAIIIEPLAPETIASRALGLREGIVASTGGRHESNLVAKYQFKEGSGNIAHDTSGDISGPIDLTLSPTGVSWVGGWGLRFDGGKAQGTTLASRKLYSRLLASGEYSIEAWVTPANTSQEGPARIVSYSGGDDVRNFMLGQSMYSYNFLNRTSGTDGNGEPSLSTAGELLQASTQHVVVTYTPVEGRRVYVNGAYTEDPDPSDSGTFSAWNDSFALVLGSEVDGSNPWRGEIRMLAIHGRALTPEQIDQNFQAGVGERFYLLFAIGHLIDAPETYVLFEGSRFDEYSYLLSAPRVVSLNEDYTPSNIPLAGMRIGVNGQVPNLGQAYTTVDVVLDGESWVPGSGQQLSGIGTIIPLASGPDFDRFFLTFERLGALENVQTGSTPPAPADPLGDPQPDIGLRLFETINVALSEITTIPTTHINAAATPRIDVPAMYELVKQQLPASDLISGFSSAHQIGITQLAMEYCSALVEDPLSTTYFAGFNLDGAYTSVLDTPAERSALIDPLILHVANTNLLSMPVVEDFGNELDALIVRLSDSCTGSCTANPVGRTQLIAKAVCTAASANAALLLQ
ncbi:MAG: LamG domain-containing protein [Pseudomonadota bacterium]